MTKAEETSSKKVLVWFRKDLRLTDNPCLAKAVEHDLEIVPVFIWSPDLGGDWRIGEASRWWLQRTLENLSEDISGQGGTFIFERGRPEDLLPGLAHKYGCGNVYFSRSYDPSGREQEEQVKSRLHSEKLRYETFKTSLLVEPREALNKSGKPFQVFTPFWRSNRQCIFEEPQSYSSSNLHFTKNIRSALGLNDLGIMPKHSWHNKLDQHWDTSARGARKLLARLRGELTEKYSHRRNIPELDATSRLSPYLAWGNVSPREVCKAVLSSDNQSSRRGENKFLAEIGWREFSHHLLYHFPKTPNEPLRSKYASFPWRNDSKALNLWQKGQTGYPLVDAGMRQLWETGWMHNRVRMVVASFLVKHLLQPWLDGARWFWDTLVDADLASNTQGWQWTAGCGADAAPYFRIFNPFGQGEKFDSKGNYVRRWVPEIAKLPAKYVHQPWRAPSQVLEESSVTLGKIYPYPIVDHSEARHEALKALQALPKE